MFRIHSTSFFDLLKTQRLRQIQTGSHSSITRVTLQSMTSYSHQLMARVIHQSITRVTHQSVAGVQKKVRTFLRTEIINLLKLLQSKTTSVMSYFIRGSTGVWKVLVSDGCLFMF